MRTDELEKLFAECNIPFDEPSFYRLTSYSVVNSHKVIHCDRDLQPTVLKLKKQTNTVSDTIFAFKRAYTQVLQQVPKSYKILTQNHIARINIARKIATLCLREFKRGMLKTGKTNIFLKGRKVGREVLVALRRTDRNEDNKRRKEELERKKEESERKKREFEEMETERQAKKLDFLITQTELYSHFVLNKKNNILGAKDGVGKEINGAKRVKVDDTRKSEVDEKADFSYDKAKERALEAAQKQIEHVAHYNLIENTKSSSKLGFPGGLKYSSDGEHCKRQSGVGNARKIQQRQGDTYSSSIPNSNTAILARKSGNVDANAEEVWSSARIRQPDMLKGRLKEYQLRGLNWLVNLYNQGINGILADDMGLGKTIQSISFLAYLFEIKGLTGPFLIVTPTSTLPNWAHELERFVPKLSVIKYYGNLKERRRLKFSNGNVVLTSYSVSILDEKYFLKQKWQYMILDEAQAIKSNKSLRWNKLLRVKTRNRLLLTGTPIQNNLKELWSLLHFIMPTLFDNLLEFEDWFLKMNDDKLDRLHVILKPFMLRREKKDVAFELKEKKIMVIYCNLSYRQKLLYDILEKRCPINFKDEEVANVLMHYRKVCNHPDLFQKSEVETGFSFHLRDNGRKNLGFRSAIGIKLPISIWNGEKQLLRRPATSVPDYFDKILERSRNRFFFTRIRMCSVEGYDAYEELDIVRMHKIDIKRLEAEAEKGIPALCYKRVIDGYPRIITDYNGIIKFDDLTPRNNLSLVKVPDASNLIKDSGKLETLDALLDKLDKEGHRPLIYFQMTRMMDLMEEYLKIKKYKYLRLDGSMKISERREVVERWQHENIFIFLLSTRAGGLGINLTAADTVVFYDNDWNPTVDKQAMDRAHRLGQVRDVTVYKLVCLGTVEEKIMRLAGKKDEIQKMIIEKGDFVGADI